MVTKKVPADAPQQLSEKVCEQIEGELKKYPADQRQAAVMSALTAVQKDNDGSLTEPLMDLVADYLGMPKIAVYEVASFYSMYELKPVGRHKICVCTNVSCMLCGCETIVNHLKKTLNINFGEITEDGKFSLKEVECLAACSGAPMMQIGEHYYEDLTPDKVDTILAELE